MFSHRIEDRPGTPTIDEPGIGSTVVSNGRGYPPTSSGYNNGPPGVIPPIMGGLPQPSVMQVCLCFINQSRILIFI